MYNSQTPIDIHCSKLVDWLVQRRHCRKDWGENLASTRRKIRAALQDMPENEEIKQLLLGSKLDYFKSKRIVEILKTTEASSKNIFGYYSSQRMKDWQDIVSSYENNCVYLAEIATDLIRETNYEVPGIRKAINKLQKEKEELEKERANLLRRTQQFQAEYQKIAQNYGVKGVDISQEFEEQSKTLVDVMDEIVSLSKDLKSPLETYRDYSSLTSKQDSSKFAAMLEYIVKKGNTTVYEWKHGESPDRIETINKATSIAGNSNPSEIELVDDEIDFGEDLPSSESSSGFVHVDKEESSNKNIEDSFIKVEQDNSHGSICNSNDKVASGDEAKLVLEFRKSRSQFLNNLHELKAFYLRMSLNVSGDDDKSSSFVASGSRAQSINQSQISQVLNKIEQIMSVMNKEKNCILFQMNDSSAFLENIKEKFSQKLKQASDCTIKADLLSDHIKDLEAQIKETEIHLKKSIYSAKELQDKVEISLRDLYNGRSINIMGCVN